MTGPQTLTGFLDALAEGTPAPGGGAAAAITAALAAALTAMAGRLALSRGDPAVRPAAEHVVESAEALRARLLELSERDSRAYRALLAALRSGEGGEAERAAGRMVAWREAARVPAEVVRASREVCLLARRMAREGLPSARGDALMATLLAAAAAAGSQVNLRLNLQGAGRPEDLRVLADQSEILLRDTQRAAAEARMIVEEGLTGLA